MTGYGRGGASYRSRRIVVELKSVNHRYMDIKLRGISLDAATEDRVNALVRDGVHRGALTVTIKIEGGGGAPAVRPDVDAARRVYRELAELAMELHINQPIGLELVCAQPGVMVPVESSADADELGAAVVEATRQGLEALVAMRTAEGEALSRDLAARLRRISEIADEIGRAAAAAPEEAKRRLRERLERLLKDSAVTVDEERLAQEIAILADRQDTTEELVRLRSHIDQFAKLMKTDKPVGRRLDFLVQELGREVNTVGSKSQSADIATLVVEAKAELEKIREQVQNVE